jgi:hypothetical protein
LGQGFHTVSQISQGSCLFFQSPLLGFELLLLLLDQLLQLFDCLLALGPGRTAKPYAQD